MSEHNIPPAYPSRSLTSQGVLYRPLQDIEIYVEDENSEIFYTELLSRLVSPEHSIKKIIPLGGRSPVIEECQKYDETHPAIFLLDGDLNWFVEMDLPEHERLYIHPCYSIENYLFNENALIEIIFENHGGITRGEIKDSLDWEKFKANCVNKLSDLFCVFGVAFLNDYEDKTIKIGFGNFCTCQKKSLPKLNSDKINKIIDNIKNELLKNISEVEFNEAFVKLQKRLEEIPDKTDAISGKNFMFPIAFYKIYELGKISTPRKSLYIRLAKHCSLEKLEPLKNFIFDEITRWQ